MMVAVDAAQSSRKSLKRLVGQPGPNWALDIDYLFAHATAQERVLS
jgi:hypothetical protein